MRQVTMRYSAVVWATGAVIGAVVAISVATTALADIAPDPLFSGGTTVTPLAAAPADGKKATPVAMLAEEVDLTPTLERNGVKAVFHMKNTGDSDTEIEIGFPSYFEVPLEDFACEVDGQKQTTERKKVEVSRTKQRFVYWMCWHMKFPAGQERTITVSYTVANTPDQSIIVPVDSLPPALRGRVYSWSSGYVLHTAAAWAGAVGQAAIRVHYGQDVARRNLVKISPAKGWKYDEQSDVDTLLLENFEPQGVQDDIAYTFDLMNARKKIELLEQTQMREPFSPRAVLYLLQLIEKESPASPERTAREIAVLDRLFPRSGGPRPPEVSGKDGEVPGVAGGKSYLVQSLCWRLLRHYQQAGDKERASALSSYYVEYVKTTLDRVRGYAKEHPDDQTAVTVSGLEKVYSRALEVDQEIGHMPAAGATLENVKSGEGPAVRITPEREKERDRLLAEADQKLRRGLLALAEKFPQLRQTNYGPLADGLAKPSPAGQIRIAVGRYAVGRYGGAANGATQPVAERDSYLFELILKPVGGEAEQFKVWDVFQNLGLEGRFQHDAGDVELQDALVKLLGEALAPLKALNRLSCDDTRLTPFGERLARLTTTSTPQDVIAILGEGKSGRIISMGFSAVYPLANGRTLEITSLPATGGWYTSALYVPASRPERTYYPNTEIVLREENPDKPAKLPRIIQPAAPAADKGAWGEAVEGVQVLLRAEKAQCKAGEQLTVLADVRNQGNGEPHVSRTSTLARLKVDDQWYRWIGPFAGRVATEPLPPGRQLAGIRFLVPDPGWEAENGGAKLTLKPGKHQVQVAIVFLPKAIAAEKRFTWAVSNAVEIEIVAAELPAALENVKSGAAVPADADAAAREPAAQKLLAGYLVEEVSLGSMLRATDIALSPDGGRLWACADQSHQIVVFDTAEARLIGAFGIGTLYNPFAIHYNKADGRLYVVDEARDEEGRGAAIRVYDPATMKPLRTVYVGDQRLYRVADSALTSDGKRLWLISQEIESNRWGSVPPALFLVDLAEGTSRQMAGLPPPGGVPGNPRFQFQSAFCELDNHDRLLASGLKASTLSVFQPGSDRAPQEVALPFEPKRMHATSNGRLLLAADERLTLVDTEKLVVLKTIALKATVAGICSDESGRRAFIWFAKTNDIVIVDTGTGTVEDPITLPGSPQMWEFGRLVSIGRGERLAGIARGGWCLAVVDLKAKTVRGDTVQKPCRLCLSPDRSVAYYGCEQSGNLVVFDLAAGRFMGTIPLGCEPEGLLMLPDGKSMLITDPKSLSLKVVDLTARKVVRSVALGNIVPSYLIIPSADYSRVCVDFGYNGPPGSYAVVDLKTWEVEHYGLNLGKKALPDEWQEARKQRLASVDWALPVRSYGPKTGAGASINGKQITLRLKGGEEVTLRPLVQQLYSVVVDPQEEYVYVCCQKHSYGADVLLKLRLAAPG